MAHTYNCSSIHVGSSSCLSPPCSLISSTSNGNPFRKMNLLAVASVCVTFGLPCMVNGVVGSLSSEAGDLVVPRSIPRRPELMAREDLASCWLRREAAALSTESATVRTSPRRPPIFFHSVFPVRNTSFTLFSLNPVDKLDRCKPSWMLPTIYRFLSKWINRQVPLVSAVGVVMNSMCECMMFQRYHWLRVELLNSLESEL